MAPRFSFPSKAKSRARRRETRRTRDDTASLAPGANGDSACRIGPGPEAGIARARARVRGEDGGHRYALTRGHRTDALVVADGHRQQELVAAFPAPLALAEQNLGDRHALELPAVAQDNLGGCELTACDSPLDERARPADPIGALECPDVLSTTGRPGIHDLSASPHVAQHAEPYSRARPGKPRATGCLASSESFRAGRFTPPTSADKMAANRHGRSTSAEAVVAADIERGCS
jgi:hypothetical protein